MSSKNFVQQILETSEPVNTDTKYLKDNESWKFSVARVMLTGIIKNQYYRSEDEIAKESVTTLMEAAKKDPEYLLKATAFARDLNMKGMVKVAICAIAGNASEKFLSDPQNRKRIVSVLSTFHPKQLMQFVELQKSKAFGRGFGSRPQKWLQDVIKSWSEDKLERYSVQYRSDMNKLLRLVHVSLNGNVGQLARYALTASDKFPQNGKAFGKVQIAAEKMKQEKDPLTLAKLMVENNVPWEAVKGFYSDYATGPVGLSTITQMGLSALLLNIASLERGGSLTGNGFETFKQRLDEVKAGRSLPIDFAKPYLKSENDNVKNELVKAIVKTLSVSYPEIEKRSVAVSIDVSGSMSDDPIKTAGMLAIPFLKAKSLWFTTFDTSLYEEGRSLCPKISGLEPEKQVHNLLNMGVCGGTNVAISIARATETNRKVDLFVLVTDEQQNAGTPLMHAWEEYRKKVNPRAELMVVNASNNVWHSADFNDPSVTVYQSLTPAVFKNLQFLGQDLVSAVEEYNWK